MDPILTIQRGIAAHLSTIPTLAGIPILAEAEDGFLDQVRDRLLLAATPVALIITTPEAGPDQADADDAILTDLTIEVRQLYHLQLQEIPAGLTPSTLGHHIRRRLHGTSPAADYDTLRFAGFSTELDEDLARTVRTQRFTLTAQLL